MTLTGEDFAAYFEAVHGNPPFPWQQRLVEQLAGDNQWPDVLDLPTGAGKTAALDAAVFHLALQADSKERCAPLRIVLVVDRRLVVDDAHRRARRIAAALRDPAHVAEPGLGRVVVKEMARRLQRLAGEGENPLVAVRLRGGAPLEHDWARTPTQPTILCSTVDQVGSRLLFRGYGVSDRMRPVHAGLLGEDSLILLDEAHLSEPFQHTLQAVRELGKATVTTVVLTATPGRNYERPFGLAPEDRKHPVLRARIAAAKPARLMKPVGSPDPAGSFTPRGARARGAPAPRRRGRTGRRRGRQPRRFGTRNLLAPARNRGCTVRVRTTDRPLARRCPQTGGEQARSLPHRRRGTRPSQGAHGGRYAVPGSGS